MSIDVNDSTSETQDSLGTDDDKAVFVKSNPKQWITAFIMILLVIVCSTGMFLPTVSPEAVGGFAIVLMITLIFLKIPVAMAMFIPAFMGMISMRGWRLVESMMTTLPYDQVASWSLSVVPMFIVMGLLLWRAGLTESVYRAMSQLIGWLPGGLAIGTNWAGAGLAAVSGSSVGTTYALTRIGVPEMLKAGYDKRLALGAVIVAGLPGQLIPPSIMLVIYAGIAEVPVGPQLLAGIGPGLLVAFMFSVMISILAVRWSKPAEENQAEKAGEPRPNDVPAKDTEGMKASRLRALAGIWPVPLLIVVIIVGMFSGVFTATEAGSVAALLSIVITFIWKPEGGAFRAIVAASTEAVAAVGAIFLMLVGVAALSRMFTLTGISDGFAELVKSMDLNRITFLLIMMVVYIILGMFMDPLAIMVLTIPILIPTLHSLDISLLWYGAFAVLLGEIAIVTPPVGILSYIIHSITNEREVNQGHRIGLQDVFSGALWFLPMAIVVTVILIVFPEISTWFPSIMSAGG